MIKKILFLCMMLMILLMPKGPVEAAGITAYEKFISPAYWTEHNADGDKVVLNAAERLSIKRSLPHRRQFMIWPLILKP